MPTHLEDYRELLLGSRLKRLAEALYAGVDAVYAAHGVDLPSRCFPVLFLLRDNPPLAITELAARLGQSHPAVSQLSRLLLRHGVVTERADRADERRRLLALSPKGAALMQRMEPLWHSIVAAVDEVGTVTKTSLLPAVSAFDQALEEKGFAKRIEAHLRRRVAESVRIIPFETRYRGDFKRLNLEWLQKYFAVEPIDVKVLSNPEAIVKRGGYVLLARYEGEIVGTCALLKSGKGRFEVSKMSVTPRYQGVGIGHKLLLAAIEQFKTASGTELFLETSSKLGPALALYERTGFRRATPPGTSHYQRTDVYMVYEPSTYRAALGRLRKNSRGA